MTGRYLAVAVCAAACASPSLHGAHTVFPGTEPAGTVLTERDVVDCRDASGAPVPVGPARILVVALPSGEPVLIEHRAAYESLVVTNSFEAPPERVFQAEVESTDGTPRLREYRLALGGREPGALVIADRYRVDNTPDGFAAAATEVALRCVLVPR